MQNFTQAIRFLSLGRGGSPAQELKTCQKKTQASNTFSLFVTISALLAREFGPTVLHPSLWLMTAYLHSDFPYTGLLSLHPLENGEHGGCFSPWITVNSIFLLHLLQGTRTKPPSNVSTTSSWRGPAFEPQPPRRVPGQCRVFVAGRGSEEDSAPAPGLGETSIPHRHCPVPSSQCSIAQALWKEGWISRAFRVFKMGGGGDQCQIPLNRRYCMLAEATFHRLQPFEIWNTKKWLLWMCCILLFKAIWHTILLPCFRTQSCIPFTLRLPLTLRNAGLDPKCVLYSHNSSSWLRSIEKGTL